MQIDTEYTKQYRHRAHMLHNKYFFLLANTDFPSLVRGDNYFPSLVRGDFLNHDGAGIIL
jgi:hypothetical protein